MKLHEDKEQFEAAIRITASMLDIKIKFVEKDYWICQVLQRLSRLSCVDRAVWKGGTSLTKGYGIINRFSSDVDLAIIADGLSNNQQKKLVLHLGKDTTVDLIETEGFGKSIKNSRFRKTTHQYNSVIQDSDSELDFLGNHVIVEINTYGNPYPYVQLSVKSFITEMMERRGLHDLIEELDMAPFMLNVLDKRRTMCEKIVSLLRFSFEEDPVKGLISKVRHFYDLHFLSQDFECRKYLTSEFRDDLIGLILHDKAEFDRPPKWCHADLLTSPLFTDFGGTWNKIAPVYLSEVGSLTFGELPPADAVANSMEELLKLTKEVISESLLTK